MRMSAHKRPLTWRQGIFLLRDVRLLKNVPTLGIHFLLYFSSVRRVFPVHTGAKKRITEQKRVRRRALISRIIHIEDTIAPSAIQKIIGRFFRALCDVISPMLPPRSKIPTAVTVICSCTPEAISKGSAHG